MNERLVVKRFVLLGSVALSAVLALSGCGASQSTESPEQVEGQAVLDKLTSGDSSSNWRIDSFGGSGSAVQVILGDPDCAVWLYATSSEAATARSVDLGSTPTSSIVSVGGYYAVVAGSNPMSSCVSGALSALGSSNSNSNEDKDPKTVLPTRDPLPYWEPTESNILKCIELAEPLCEYLTHEFRDGSSYGTKAPALIRKLASAGVCTLPENIEQEWYKDTNAVCVLDNLDETISIETNDSYILIFTPDFVNNGYAYGKGWIAYGAKQLSATGFDLPKLRKRIAETLGGKVYDITR